MRLTALLTLTTALVSVTGWPVASGPNLAAELLRRQDTGTLGPAPANRTGCVAHGDHWDCDPIEGEEEHDHDHKAEEAAATGNSTVTEVHDHDHDHDHANSTTSAVNATATAVPAGCEQHGDHWHCENEADEIALNATANATTTAVPAGCEQHGDHWHCENEADEIAMNGGTSAAAEVAGDDTCVIHLGHTHGNCSQEQVCSGTLGKYNMGLHIGSVFIVLVGSALGVAIPLVAKQLRRDQSTEGPVFFIARHFGTASHNVICKADTSQGIIISTAFVHLMYHGFSMFASPCLDGLLHYESTAPALAMAAAFIMFLLDFFGARAAGSAGHGAEAHVHGVVGGGGEAAIASKTNSAAEADASEKGDAIAHHDHEDHAHSHVDESEKQQRWQVLLLEAGIIFHSIMIGITLGAGSGAGWTTLLIVIIFHQFFEGAALGARIALLSISRVRAMLMGLAFAIITPIGIGIGIGVRNALAANPRDAMIAVGVLNSLSAGILLYTAFKLLSVDFVEGPLRRASVRRILAAVAAMAVGMAAMSVLGKWA